MLLLQLFVNGLIASALYALMAVGFAMIYNGTRILHLAHGAVFTFAGYALYALAVGLGWPVLLALGASVVLAAALGVLMELLVYRPLRKLESSPAALLIASVGLLTFFQALYALAFTTDTRVIRQGPLPTYELGPVTVTGLHVAVAAVALAIFPVLQLFLVRSKWGRAIRALGDNPRLALVLGMDTDRLYLVIFALGSALAGIAAGLISLDLGVRPEMGLSIMFAALVAVIVGGIGYLPGAAAGALVLGVLQHLPLWQLSARWQDVAVFGTLVLFLIFRPQGIFGGRLAARRA
jgi:branched-chain amino acid transport system permease protein